MTVTTPRRGMALASVASLALLSGCGLLGGSVPSAEVGDCMTSDSFSGDEIDELPTVDCGEPHDLEVFHVFDLPDGDFPGQDAAYEAGEDGCYEQFHSYVGEPYESSVLEFSVIAPTGQTWDEANDREVICLLVSFEDVSESLRDSGL